jgi:hypothetical protein
MGLLLSISSLFMTILAVQIDDKLSMDVVELLDLETSDDFEPVMD